MKNLSSWKSNAFFVAVMFLLLSQIGQAAERPAPDFYGIKMKSESFARGLEFDAQSQTPKFINGDKEGFDKNIYAVGELNESGSRVLGVHLTVFNNTDEAFGADYLFREFIVVDKEGERYTFGEPFALTKTQAVQPNQSAGFDILFGKTSFKKDNIQKIICSFDMGNIKIVLLPVPAGIKSFPVAEAVKAPQSPKVEMPKSKPEVSKKVVEIKTDKKAFWTSPKKETKVEIREEKKGSERKIASSKGFWRGDVKRSNFSPANLASPKTEPKKTVSEVKKVEVKPAVAQAVNIETPKKEKIEVKTKSNFSPANAVSGKAEPKKFVIETKKVQAKPSMAEAVKNEATQKEKKEAKTNFWSKKSVAKEDPTKSIVGTKKTETTRNFWGKKSQATVAKIPAISSKKLEGVDKSKVEPIISRAPRSSGQVISADNDNGFFVANVGEIEGLSKGQKLGVLRRGRFIAMGLVKQIRSDSLAAVILQDESVEKIQVGDSVTIV